MRRGRRSSALLAVVVLAVFSQRATAIPANLLLDNSSVSPYTHSNPTIRSYGNKVVAVWHDVQTGGSSTEPRIHYAVSTDSGATFIDLGAPPQPNGTGRWRGDPQLTVDPSNGNFFLVGQASAPALGIWLTRGTFSGAVLTWNTPVLVRTSTTGTILPGLLALDCSPSGDVLHLLYQTGAGAIEYQRSTDGNGAVWSGPLALSSPGDAGNVAYPQLAASWGGLTYAAWAGPTTLGTQPIRIRTSTDQGASWGVEQTVITRMNAANPGQSQVATNNIHRPPFSMAVNRVLGSSTHTALALAWGEPWDFTDEPFPALTGTVLRNETEPNNNLASANGFNIGDALMGTMSDGFDEDWWTVTLAAGNPILVWSDSVTGPIQMFVSGPDGVNQINGYSGGPAATLAFRAPTAGTYAIRVAPRGGPPNFYRIRTRLGTPSPGEGRDARDIAVAFAFPLESWTIRHYPFGPVGYDDYLPTIGFGADGLDYVTWYDLSRGGLPGTARLVVARNLAGGDPVPSPPVTLSDFDSSFNDYLIYFPPGIGCANDVFGGDNRLFMTWTDIRNFTTDAYAASIRTDAYAIAFPNDTTAQAGTTVTLHGRILNRNPEFQEKVLIRQFGARSWPGGAVTADSIPVNSTGIVSIPIAIPDTAAAGPYTVTIIYERQSGLNLGGHGTKITILPATGVAEDVRIAKLEPVVPNPTRGVAHISFTLARASEARVDIFGLQGERVRNLARGNLTAGPRALEWNGRDDQGRTVPAGLYFVALETAGYRAVRPVVVVR